ncbi:hypothetical protein [Streptomyces sp. NPDC058045]|uniref:hypothetical protein n=1 Tax=Streptomyces sp. NPDC058045 TaxID=3346311 RepID=UPI0036E3E4CD
MSQLPDQPYSLPYAPRTTNPATQPTPQAHPGPASGTPWPPAPTPSWATTSTPTTAPPPPPRTTTPPPAPPAHPTPRHPTPPPPDTPPTRTVPHFAPVRVRGGSGGSARLTRHRRRALAAGIALTTAALVAAAGPDAPHPRTQAPAPPAPPAEAAPAAAPHPPPQGHVRAPIRVADAETVRLLHPGDRVDVVTAGDPTGGDTTGKVLATGARVVSAEDSSGEDGALIVVEAPRPTAARLVAAGASSRLAVTLW